jgi:hypothetical protein
MRLRATSDAMDTQQAVRFTVLSTGGYKILLTAVQITNVIILHHISKKRF